MILKLKKTDQITKLHINTQSSLWSEKYRPQNFSEIIGNKKQIIQIKKWFENKNKSKNSNALFFTGTTGTSKTTLAHIAMNAYGYDIRELELKKNTLEMCINRILNNELITKYLSISIKPIGIIIDEITTDKWVIEYFIKILKNYKNYKYFPPIIFINNGKFNKELTILKKHCEEIKFYKPTNTELRELADLVCKENNCEYTDEMIIHSQNDYRRLLNILQDGELDTCRKILDMNNFDIINKLFNNYLSINTIKHLYEYDKNIIPMMIYENYIDNINAQLCSQQEKYDKTRECIDNIINADILEKFMYNTQTWHLRNLHMISSCYIPSIIVNSTPKCTIPINRITKVLGKYSQYRSYLLNIQLLISILQQGCIYNTFDIYLLCKLILYYLFDNNMINVNSGIILMKKYNLTIKDIEKIIKTNKLITDYKSLYKIVVKQKLTKLYGGDYIQKNMVCINYNKSDDDDVASDNETTTISSI